MTVLVELGSFEEMDDRPEHRTLIYNQSPRARVTDCAARVRHRLQSKVGLDLLWRGKRFYIHQPSQAQHRTEPSPYKLWRSGICAGVQQPKPRTGASLRASVPSRRSPSRLRQESRPGLIPLNFQGPPNPLSLPSRQETTVPLPNGTSKQFPWGQLVVGPSLHGTSANQGDKCEPGRGGGTIYFPS